MLTHGIPLAFRGGVHLFIRQPPSGHSRVYRIAQLRADGVHWQESAGAVPVVLKVVPVTGAPFSGIIMDGPINVRLDFPTPIRDTEKKVSA